MLEDLDTSRFIPNSAYKTELSRLEMDLGVLHRQSKEMGIPVMILFEGWDA
jgi:polyphosphate kinase 2 (PPK2 family)